MAEADASSSVERLVEILDDQLIQSEWEILTALAKADEPLTVDELAEETGYTERTVKKRLGTLEEKVHGGTLLSRNEDGSPELHPQFARTVRDYQS